MRLPDPGLLARLAAGLERPILLLTLAPERPGAMDLIRWAHGRGMLMAMGHSAADAAVVEAAAAAGVRLSTHLGNALPRMQPKFLNPMMAQLAEDRLVASFIADGIHVPPPVLKVLLRAKGLDRAVLVTDATAAASAPPGLFGFAGMAIEGAADGSVRDSGERAAGRLWPVPGPSGAQPRRLGDRACRPGGQAGIGPAGFPAGAGAGGTRRAAGGGQRGLVGGTLPDRCASGRDRASALFRLLPDLISQCGMSTTVSRRKRVVPPRVEGSRQQGGCPTMIRSLAVAAALSLAPCVTLAQNPQPAAPGAPPLPLAPPTAEVSPPEQIAPGPNNPGTSGTEGMSPGRSGTFSEKLSRQQGTLYQPP